MRHILAVAALGVFLASPALAAPIVINFDDLANGNLTGPVVSNQYAGVLFSSTSGNVNYVSTQSAYNGTKPAFLCSGPVGGGISCVAETVLTFSSAVSDLTFQAMGVNDIGNVAKIDIFQNGLFSSTFTVVGAASIYDPELVDLSAWANITQIRIYDITDGAGIGWDTFSYNQVSGVPDLASSILLLGIALVGLRMYRRG